MGLSMSQWDELDDHDRAWALALDVTDAEKAVTEAAASCEACGGPKAECQDPDNQHAYVVTFGRCYRTRAVQEAQRKRSKDPDMGSLLVKVTLDPTRKKSARKKG